MTVVFAGSWLDDIRAGRWYARFSRRQPSTLGEGDELRWAYLDDEGNSLYANLAEEILSVNQPFLQSFDQNVVWNALGTYAMSNLEDATNGAHNRAIVSEEDGDEVTVEQGMHQPEEDEGSDGFYLHVTLRLTATTVDADQASVGAPRHAYLMQNDDGSLYVTSMT
jgi:hypothetical protein